MANGVLIWEKGPDLCYRKPYLYYERLAKPEFLVALQEQNNANYQLRLAEIEEAESQALAKCAESLEWCIQNHKNPKAYVDRGFFYYLEGNSLDALDLVKAALKHAPLDTIEKLQEEALFLILVKKLLLHGVKFIILRRAFI
jgi:hypothetical protein